MRVRERSWRPQAETDNFGTAAAMMAGFATARARRTIESPRSRRDQAQVNTKASSSQTRTMRHILQVESTRARAEVQRARASSRQGGGEKAQVRAGTGDSWQKTRCRARFSTAAGSCVGPLCAKTRRESTRQTRPSSSSTGESRSVSEVSRPDFETSYAGLENESTPERTSAARTAGENEPVHGRMVVA